jgi:hypothetical protein
MLGLSRRNLEMVSLRSNLFYWVLKAYEGSIDYFKRSLVGQILLPHQVHYSMLPTSGYPLAGCSPAEPASVSPDTFYTRFFFG